MSPAVLPSSPKENPRGLVGLKVKSPAHVEIGVKVSPLAEATAIVQRGACLAIWVDVRQRIVPNVGIHVPALWIFDLLIRERLIRTAPPALSAGVIAEAKVIETPGITGIGQLGIAFFAGELDLYGQLLTPGTSPIRNGAEIHRRPRDSQDSSS